MRYIECSALNTSHWLQSWTRVISRQPSLKASRQDMTCIGSKQLESKLQSLIEYWPAPTIPIAKMELCDTSASLSCDNLLRVSTILSWGLDADRIARAKGTARRITGSPYCSWNEKKWSDIKTSTITWSQGMKQSSCLVLFCFFRRCGC